MKKIFRTVLCLALIGAVLFAFTACGEKEEVYTGEYDNEPYYCKVHVTIKGEKILRVELEPDTADKYIVTPGMGNYADIFESNVVTILRYYEGKTLDEVAELPSIEGGTAEETPYAIAGATQSSNRVLTAVQNAISKIKEDRK